MKMIFPVDQQPFIERFQFWWELGFNETYLIVDRFLSTPVTLIRLLLP